ncbi:MAG: uroporphyrinogen-III synthase [Flavobacteriaceae bacterium]|nr:uroporphyrinogen-III synthase [Eudoraea sp.]NNJ37732.1 uroporphyrinogen-III synthase [Flavobacteriaceae bacterium]
MMRILSTKILTESQKALLRPLDIALTEYQAISVSYLAFEPARKFDYYLITSQNAVRSLLAHIKGCNDPEFLLSKNAFCVGKKTAALLEHIGVQVAHFEENAADLGHYLAKHHFRSSFLFLCGDMRREELPEILNDHGISYREVHVYETALNAVSFETDYDGYLFFSPSAVKSYQMKNPINSGMAYCIGPTTAAAAKNAGMSVRVADSPTVEAVLKMLVQTIKN